MILSHENRTYGKAVRLRRFFMRGHLSLLQTVRWLRAGLALAKTCPREQSLPNSARREQSLLRTRPREESLKSNSCPSLATLHAIPKRSKIVTELSLLYQN